MTIKLTRLDLDYILTQIQMAEAGQFPVNPLLSFGLRTVDGTMNNMAPGQSTYGSSFQTFPSVTDPLFQTAQAMAPGALPTSYAQTKGMVYDAQPRQISLMVANSGAKILDAGPDLIKGTADDVVQANAAALAAQANALNHLGAGYQNTTLPGPDGIYGTSDDTGTTVVWQDGTVHTTFGNLATPTKASNSSSTIPNLPQSLFIPNIAPDNGLSAPFNSFFTIFGQFFDHGLDLISKSDTDFVAIPLMPDDPLYNPATPGNNFMFLNRATDQPGPDGKLGTADDVHQYINQITPFVDQSQTYASDSSHQAFLREYMIGSDGLLHSTGALLSGAPETDATGGVHTTLATWANLKANAANILGIKLDDTDVNAVPLLATDAYGNLTEPPPPFGSGQPLALNERAFLHVRYTDAAGGEAYIAGNVNAPVPTHGLFNGRPYTALTTGGGFIDDKAPTADPVDPASSLSELTRRGIGR